MATYQVTVKFEDGAHSFLLWKHATLTELADCIGVLGARHIGVPISIDIQFSTPLARSTIHSHPLHLLTH